MSNHIPVDAALHFTLGYGPRLGLKFGSQPSTSSQLDLALVPLLLFSFSSNESIAASVQATSYSNLSMHSVLYRNRFFLENT